MPAGIFEGSIADVSLVVGMMTEKFLYHMPLYRQHQKNTARWHYPQPSQFDQMGTIRH